MDMQAYHAVGMELARMFQINRRSEIVTFDKYPPNASDYEKSCRLTTGKKNKKVLLQFQPRRWFKDRIGTIYSGYNDPKLLALLVPPV